MIDPVVFLPSWHRRLWGAREWTSTGFTAPDAGRGDPYGECWLLSPIPGHESRTGDGTSLTSLLTHHAEAMLGAAFVARFGPQFPVMVKLLNTTQVLSVQVHPKPTARDLSCGKDECWIVVDCADRAAGAQMSVGLRDGWDAAKVEALVAQGPAADWAPALDAVTVAPGDAADITGGTVHALGAGVAVLEIQLPCDITYRLSDWGRVGADGAPRALHIDKGTAAIAWPQPARAFTPGWIDGDEPLTTAAYTVRPSNEMTLAGGTWRVVIPWDGTLFVHAANTATQATRLMPVLIPAGCGDVRIVPRGATRWIVVRGAV
jgi:mannose-6-phosphate isomerase